MQDPNLKFHAPTQCFVSFSQKSNVRFWHTSSVQKTFQKPFQNEVRTLPKSMPKSCCFLTSFFSGFGLDFGGSWTSMLEPSWLLKPQKTISVAHFYLLKLNVFKQLRLRGLWPRFWKPRGSILEGPGSIFKGFGRLKRCLKAFLGGEHFATDLSCIIGPFAGEKWSRSCRATGHLPRMPVLLCPGSDGRGAHGVGGRRCPPPRGLSIN